MVTVSEIIELSGKRLQKAGIFQPRAEAKTIVLRVLDINEEMLDEKRSLIVEEEKMLKINEVLAQREKDIPVPRIFGSTRFCGLEITVNPGVFLAYPETEVLVEHVLLSIPSKENSLRILDLGTGTGCILLALLKSLPNASGIGIDCDEASLNLARHNAATNGLGARAEFRIGDWCDGITETFDIIVSNPPCIKTERIHFLLPEMRKHETVTSLDGGPDGLKFHRLLVENFEKLAKKDALLHVQVGSPNTDQVKILFEKAGYDSVKIKTNYLGVPACLSVVFRKKPSWIKRLQGVFTRSSA